MPQRQGNVKAAWVLTGPTTAVLGYWMQRLCLLAQG
jgi:hypothetical protein